MSTVNQTNAQSPVILGHSHVMKCLSDDKFYELFPEYYTLQYKLKTMKIDLTQKQGCSSCQKRRAASSVFNDFVFITLSLNEDSKQRLKEYLNIKSLIINSLDPVTRQPKLIFI